MLKKIIILALLIFTCLILSSCWDRREIKTLGIVGSMGIDSEGDKIKLTFDIMKPTTIQGKGRGTVTNIFQTTGTSVIDAMTNSTIKFDLELFHAHTKAYIFSEDFAKNKLSDCLDYFNRDGESRRFVNIMVAKGSNASDIIGISSGQDESPNSYLESLADNTKYNAKSISTNFIDYMTAENEEGIEPVLGVIQAFPKGKVPPTTKYEPSISYPDLELHCEGLAVFSNGKFVGFLDGIETRGYNWISGKTKGAIVVAASSDGANIYSLRTIDTSVKRKVEYNGENAVINISIKVNGTLGEVNGKSDVKNMNYIADVEKQTAQIIKNEIDNTIKKLQQEYKSDIFGFGQTMHKKSPYKWKEIKNNWSEIFPQAQVTSEVKVSIKRTGVTMNTKNKNGY
jgi:spore germination protein KC